MKTSRKRYDRSMRLFGAEGQGRLSATSVAVVGVSGLGSPLVQHLALLGVREIALIEPKELDETNRNRFVGAWATDPVPGSLKVKLARRLIRKINPDVRVKIIPKSLVSADAFAAIRTADWIIGGLDHDGPRYVLNEMAAAYGKPYIDLASDVPEPGVYGGHVCVAWNGNGCLSCLGLLDIAAVNTWLMSPADRLAHDAIYGVNRAVLADRGPSVSPINGVVASLGATEFMVAVTGLRPPRLHLNFRGHLGIVTDGSREKRAPYCAFCNGDRGNPASFDIERYLRMPHLVGA